MATRDNESGRELGFRNACWAGAGHDSSP
jgi:hypothetical protein